jgi:hypothetical protein
VKLRVTSVELYDYTKVAALAMSGEGGAEVRLELPLQVVDEVGWGPKAGDEVELELSASAGDLDAWDIVLSGSLLKAGEGAVTFTFGGLLCTVRGAGIEPLKRVYLKLRVPRSAATG